MAKNKMPCLIECSVYLLLEKKFNSTQMNSPQTKKAAKE